MRLLITGVSGFAGGHLAQYLCTAQPDADLHGTIYNDHPQPDDQITYHRLDLRDSTAVLDLIASLQPDIIYHLAAQASAGRSIRQPWHTLENNIRAQFNILESCMKAVVRPRLVIITSGEIYGLSALHTIPMDETTQLCPTNPYSVSKITQDMMALQYHLSHKLDIIRARPFNHFGPGQRENFVAADFAMQIARIEAEQREPVMLVGNLSAKRDFTDVRDVVRAYHLIAEQGASGEVYNIASNHAYSIQELLDGLLSLTDKRIDVRVDPDKLRPVDVPVVQGDYSRLHTATGWQPQIPFEQTLRDVLDDCRRRVQQTNRS